MPQSRFNPDHQKVLDTLLLHLPGVTPGKMFGYPAYYVRKKLFACVYGEGIGIKLPQALADELLEQGRAIPFQPMGRPRMREWVQINRVASDDYEQDLEVLKSSVRHVGALARA